MWMGLNCYTMFILGCTWNSVFRLGHHILKQTLTVWKRCSIGQKKIFYGFGNLKYEERLERLNLFLLQYRRMRGDIIETYRIMSNLGDVNTSQFFTMSNMNNLHGQSLNLHEEHFHKVIQKNFFSKRVIDQWNGLPEEVVRAKMLNSFKNSLDK